jgi:hypothetical protein
MPTTGQPVRLAYAARPHHRGRRVRQIGVLVALVVVGIQAARHGPRTYERARLLYWQHRCLTYTPPPGQVVYDRPDDPPVTVVLRGCVPTRQFAAGSPGTAAPVPKCWAELSAAAGWAPGTSPSTGPAGAAGPAGRPIAFLHERRTPAGRRRLVVLWYDPDPIDGNPASGFAGLDAAVMVRPATWDRPSDEVSLTPSSLSGTFGIVQWRPAFRLYAGEPDPADESHFTLRYEAGGEAGTIDGWLKDPEANDVVDDDPTPDVLVRVRDGPCSAGRWTGFAWECEQEAEGLAFQRLCRRPAAQTRPAGP